MNYHHCFSFVNCIGSAKDTAACLTTTTNENLTKTTIWTHKYNKRIWLVALTLPSAYLMPAYIVLGDPISLYILEAERPPPRPPRPPWLPGPACTSAAPVVVPPREPRQWRSLPRSLLHPARDPSRRPRRWSSPIALRPSSLASVALIGQLAAPVGWAGPR